MADEKLSIPQLFARTAARFPDNEAAGGHSYSELRQLSDRYVTGLTSAGVGRGEVVCLFFGSKSIHVVSLALAIMRLGAIYVPLDPSFPANRLEIQCQQAAVAGAIKLLVHDTATSDQQAAEAVAKKLHVPTKPAPSLLAEERSNADCSSWDDFAVVLFTSGSTGQPKATGYSHSTLVTAFQAINEKLNVTPATRVCNVIPYVWDAGNMEVFAPLLYGGASCYCQTTNPKEVAQVIVEQRCTMILLPPSLMATIPTEALAHLDVIIPAGERVNPGQMRTWAQDCPRTRVMNAFGLTESGFINTFWEWPRRDGKPEVLEGLKTIPIGRTFAQNQIHLDGEEGDQIVLSGPQIPSSGYLSDREGSPQIFLPPPNKFSTEFTAMYTGDHGYKDEAGEYCFIGRKDGRLDIYSLRIEPADTESAAVELDEIDCAHLFVHEIGEGKEPSLALAYHTVGDKYSAELLTHDEYDQHKSTVEKKLHAHLAKNVPSYQLPCTYMPLGKIPRLISGKIDGKRIGELAREAQKQSLLQFTSFAPAL